MKKSNFFALIMGTIGGVFFALGMCMALVQEWNMRSEILVIWRWHVPLHVIITVCHWCSSWIDWYCNTSYVDSTYQRIEVKIRNEVIENTGCFPNSTVYQNLRMQTIL